MRKQTAKRMAALLLTTIMLLATFPATAGAASAHAWNYAPGLSQVTATCACGDATCPATVNLSLSAPTSTVYNGTPREVVIQGLQNGMTPTITYFDMQTGQPLSGAPVKIGSYRAVVAFSMAASLSLDYEITGAVIDKVNLDALVTKPDPGVAPQATMTPPAGCKATISWTPVHSKYEYNTAYVATVTLTIADDGYRFADTIDAGDWTVATDGEARVFTKTFQTGKMEISSIAPPTVPSKLTYRYATLAALLKGGELPTSVVGVTEGSTPVSIPIIWSCTYSNANSAINTFTWTLDLTNYTPATGVTTTGTVQIENAPPAVPLDQTAHGFPAKLYYGQTWADVSFADVEVHRGDGTNALVAGTWEYVGVNANERPPQSGFYRARFTPSDLATYEAFECDVELSIAGKEPKVTFHVEPVTGPYYPTHGVKITVDAVNYYDSTMHLPADLITVTCEVDGQGKLTLTPDNGTYSFVLPATAAGKNVVIHVATATVVGQYAKCDKYQTLHVNQNIPVENSAKQPTVEMAYTPNAIDVADLFVLDPNAGTPTYSITGGTAIASLNGSMLTVTKAGTIVLELTTAENGLYATGTPVTVMLTVGKAKIDVSHLSFTTVRTYTYNKTEQGPVLTGTIPAGVVPVYSGNRAINAGSYTASVTFTLASGYSADNYEIVGSVADAVWSIGKKQVTVTAKDLLAYVGDGNPSSRLVYSVTGLENGDALLTLPTISLVNYTDAVGTYTIKVEGADAGSNYDVIYVSGTLTVSYKDGRGGLSIQGWTYGQYNDAINAPVPSVEHDATPIYYYAGTTNAGKVYHQSTSVPTEAGNYTVYAYYAKTAKYAAYETTKVSFEISRATPSYTPPMEKTATFGDKLSKLSLPSGFSWQASVQTTVGDAGRQIFRVRYTPSDTNNYAVVNDIPVIINVSKLDISGASVSFPFDLTYNGELQTRFFSVDPINGQRVEVIASGDSATDAGEYEMVLTGTGNFTGTLTVTWEIVPADISAATVTLGSELFYNGSEQTRRVASVLLNGKEVTFTLSGDTRATAVGIYYLTLNGNGNFCGTKSVMWTIAPDTSAIEGLTPDNVTSADRVDVEDVLDQIASDEAKTRWADVVARCEELLNAIDQSQRTLDELLAQLDRYHIDHVKSSDKRAIEGIGREIEQLLADGNLTATERQTLLAATDKVDALLDRIDDVAQAMVDILDRLADFDAATVTADDVAAIESLISDIDALLNGDNLTAAERTEMEKAKAKAQALLDVISDVADAVDEIRSLLDGYDINSVTSADKNDIEDILEQIVELQNKDNLTAAQRASLEADEDKAHALLERIAQVAAKIQSVLERVDDYSIDTVTSDDREALQALLSDINALLGGNNLTTAERAEMEDARATVEALLARIAAAAAQMNTENVNNADKLTKDTLKNTDREVLEAAKTDLQKALTDYVGNYTKAERTEIDALLEKINELLSIFDKIDAVQDKIDQLPDVAGPTDEAAKDAYEDAKKEYDGLTDSEKGLVDTGKLDRLEMMLNTYLIVEGADGKWNPTMTGGLTFVANGAAQNVIAIKINGEVIAQTAYGVKTPLTTLTISAEYLTAMEKGEYTLTVCYGDGETSCSFVVEDEPWEFPWMWVLVLLLIFVVLFNSSMLFFLIYKKKEEKKDELEKKERQENSAQ